LWSGSKSPLHATHFVSGVTYVQWEEFKSTGKWTINFDELDNLTKSFFICDKMEQSCGLQFTGMTNEYVKFSILLSSFDTENPNAIFVVLVIDRKGNIVDIYIGLNERDNITGEVIKTDVPVWATYLGSSYNKNISGTTQMSKMAPKLRNGIINYFEKDNILLEDPIDVPDAIAIETVLYKEMVDTLPTASFRFIIYYTNNLFTLLSFAVDQPKDGSSGRALEENIIGVNIAPTELGLAISRNKDEFKYTINEFRKFLQLKKMEW